MTKEQPYVLRLADVLDGFPLLPITEAAAELRRLHEENERLKTERDELLESIKAVIAAERDELCELLKEFFSPTREHRKQVAAAWQKLHETIAKVEGQS